MQRIWDFIAPLIRYIVLVVLVFGAVLLIIRFLGVQPPQEFTIATGREGGAYYSFAQQYAERFAEEGVTLHIRETAGSVETLELLNAGEVDVGFIQNTRLPLSPDPDLSTLASLFYEALWVLYRDDVPQQPQSVADLQGLRINVNEPGSASQSAAVAVLGAHGVTAENSALSELPSAEAAELLKAGDLDAILIFSGGASPLVQELLRTPGINLLPFETAVAFSRRFKNTTPVTLYKGVIDLTNTLPAEDVPLIAARATLVANSQLHPDLARLLLIIASEVHRDGGILEEQGEFPNSDNVEIPLSADAVRYLQNGPTGLERVLPLWLASRLERYLFLLLPVALLLYPLLRGVPSLAAYFNQYRVKRRYQHLREIERQYKSYDLEQMQEAIADLEDFQQELNQKVNVPTTMLDELYDLRMHTALTLERLYERQKVLAGEQVSA